MVKQKKKTLNSKFKKTLLSWVIKKLHCASKSEKTKQSQVKKKRVDVLG
jgi:hypothetical protein